MGFLKIAQIGEPILRQPTREISRDELLGSPFQHFIDQLISTMRDANGAGLAANQVYEPVRMCAIEVGDNPRYPYKPKVPLTILINPKLTAQGDEMFDNFEGCLSVPNLRGIVPRHAMIRVEGLDRTGQPIDREIRGITAGTFQHEVDHLDGLLFVDRVADKGSFCTWENFSRHFEAGFQERAREVVQRYGS